MKRNFAATFVIVLSIISPINSSTVVEPTETNSSHPKDSKALELVRNAQKTNNKSVKINQLAENQNSLDNRKLILALCQNQNNDKKCNQNNKITYQKAIANRTEINEFENISANDTNGSGADELNGVASDKINGRRNLVCALGTAENYLWWLSKNGSLQYGTNGIDLSNRRQNESELNHHFEYAWKYVSILQFITLANNKLSAIPNGIFNEIYNKVEYLSLSGNRLESMLRPILTDSRVPELLNLKHLDLRNCNLKNLCGDDLRYFPNVEYLFLSHNKIHMIQSSTFVGQQRLKHLDLSFNNWNIIADDSLQFDISKPKNIELILTMNALSRLLELETLDLSFSRLSIRNATQMGNDNWLFGPKLKHLSLCFTMIPRVSEEMFKNANSLKVLDVSGNHKMVPSLVRDGFKYLNNLEVLYFKHNGIRSINWATQLSNLRFINLKNNLINRIDGLNFDFMPKLEIVDLSSNFVINWLTPLFKANPQISILNIRKNYINSFTNDMLRDFSAVDYLMMGDNPFECSCILKEVFDRIDQPLNSTTESERIEKFYLGEFYKLTDEKLAPGDVMTVMYQNYISKELKIALQGSLNPRNLVKSTTRRNSWHKWHDSIFDNTNLTFFMLDYNDNDYSCLNVTNKVQVTISELQTCSRGYGFTKNNSPLQSTQVEVQILIVACVISVFGFVMIILLYRKWWHIRYFCIILRNSTILSFCNDNKDDLKKLCQDDLNYNYDVFISYSDIDRKWVLDELLPQIEGLDGVCACLHERDFQVGMSILENIINCIDRSRSLLLVISKSFIQSRWCQFEMHMAQHRLLETRREQLVLVLLEDVNEKKSPRTLRYLMKTKTYIKWPSDVKGQELFWKRLKKSIVLPENGSNSIKFPVIQ